MSIFSLFSMNLMRASLQRFNGSRCARYMRGGSCSNPESLTQSTLDVIDFGLQSIEIHAHSALNPTHWTVALVNQHDENH